jgi:hypothetical protein
MQTACKIDWKIDVPILPLQPIVYLSLASSTVLSHDNVLFTYIIWISVLHATRALQYIEGPQIYGHDVTVHNETIEDFIRSGNVP